MFYSRCLAYILIICTGILCFLQDILLSLVNRCLQGTQVSISCCQWICAFVEYKRRTRSPSTRPSGFDFALLPHKIVIWQGVRGNLLTDPELEQRGYLHTDSLPNRRELDREPYTDASPQRCRLHQRSKPHMEQFIRTRVWIMMEHFRVADVCPHSSCNAVKLNNPRTRLLNIS